MQPCSVSAPPTRFSFIALALFIGGAEFDANRASDDEAIKKVFDFLTPGMKGGKKSCVGEKLRAATTTTKLAIAAFALGRT